MSWVSLKLKDISKFKFYMGITLLCSVLFLVIKYFEYESKLSNGYTPSYNNFYAVYFTITGLHAIHIIGGIIVNAYFFSALSISEVFEDYMANDKIKNVANKLLYASAVVIPLITIILISSL